jgi:DNA invertase Pin-like site-specific DNA recombinase
MKKVKKIQAVSVETGTAQRIAYARVSSDEQEMHLQTDALERAHVDQIFSEKVSAGSATRPELDACLRTLRRGDTLVVWRLDRLGRNLAHLTSIITSLADRGIGFESLKEHIETVSPAGRFQFHVFAALAEFERDLIKERTKAGLAAARARGRRGGRKPKTTPKTRQEMTVLYESRTSTVPEICARYNITTSTFYRAVLGRNYSSSKEPQ